MSAADLRGFVVPLLLTTNTLLSMRVCCAVLAVTFVAGCGGAIVECMDAMSDANTDVGPSDSQSEFDDGAACVPQVLPYSLTPPCGTTCTEVVAVQEGSNSYSLCTMRCSGLGTCPPEYVCDAVTNIPQAYVFDCFPSCLDGGCPTGMSCSGVLVPNVCH